MKVRYENLSVASSATTYTGEYLKYLIIQSGIEIDDDSQVILATVSDADAYIRLRRLRKRNQRATIITGGFEAYCGEWMLAFADYVVAGKGERFLQEMGRTGEIPTDLPEVYTKETVDVKPCYPFEDVDFCRFPLIKTRKGLLYGVAGLGCKRKCAFCMTSWAQPHRKANPSRISKLIAETKVRGGQFHLTLIDNEYSQFNDKVINVQSVRVDDVISKRIPKARTAFNMLHLGVEGFDERMRLRLGKPISNETLRAAIQKLKTLGYSCELFFISGLPNDNLELEALEEIFPYDADGWPRIHLKFTTLNPVPHTPLWTTNLRDIGELTQAMVDEWYVNFAQKRNRRLRTFPVRTPARELWRALLRRCRWWQAEYLDKAPKPCTPKDVYLDMIANGPLSSLIDLSDNEPLPNSHIITPFRDNLTRASQKWGLQAPRLRFTQ